MDSQTCYFNLSSCEYQMVMLADRRTDRQTETDRQFNRNPLTPKSYQYGHADRQTERQTETDRQTHRQFNRNPLTPKSDQYGHADR